METTTVIRTLTDTDYCTIAFHIETNTSYYYARITNLTTVGVALTIYSGGETISECTN